MEGPVPCNIAGVLFHLIGVQMWSHPWWSDPAVSQLVLLHNCLYASINDVVTFSLFILFLQQVTTNSWAHQEVFTEENIAHKGRQIWNSFLILTNVWHLPDPEGLTVGRCTEGCEREAWKIYRMRLVLSFPSAVLARVSLSLSSSRVRVHAPGSGGPPKWAGWREVRGTFTRCTRRSETFQMRSLCLSSSFGWLCERNPPNLRILSPKQEVLLQFSVLEFNQKKIIWPNNALINRTCRSLDCGRGTHAEHAKNTKQNLSAATL